ncbi:hypothetical protein EKO04_009855 [Ascochyta lentis]|uniref:Uncharacterized protein n=1 Tax=Ascochyta lentis TaxID=205686 RepID=A0A8H7IW47_9PLEO|nr:hypothetical protein EKO04_009855 [Ascochyta lentis]
MPTRPTRRERRRADRRNANKAPSPIPLIPLPPRDATLAEVRRASLTIFTTAVPVVRTVLRLILIQTSFTHGQVVGMEMWKEALEMVRPRPCAPNYAKHEHQIRCFETIVQLHDAHLRDLETLMLDYARQVVMWGLECSKAEQEWDLGFIARRRLELAQLNRTTSKLAEAFEEKLQGSLGDEDLFHSEKGRVYVIGALERFRSNFAHGVVVADEETMVELEVGRLVI